MKTVYPRVLFHTVAVFGMTVAVAYAAGWQWLISLGSPVPMRLTTALVLAMLGAACAALLPCPLPRVVRYTISATFAVCAFVMLTGLVVRRLWLNDIDALDMGGMPSLGTMIAFGLVATACLLRTVFQHCGVYRWCGIGTFLIGVVAAFGHAFDAPALYWSDVGGIGVAPHTAAALAALGVGLCLVPRERS